MKPIRELILVKPFESEEQTVGGIFVPDSYKSISNKVEVVEVGNGTKDNPMRFKKGDIGFRIKDSGEEFLINGERHFIINQNWLLAKIECHQYL